MNEEEIRNTPKLGFGLMRLPHKGIGIDVDQTAEMADLFLNAGFTYFDTAYVYPGSEAAIKKALVDRHPRSSYTLADKLYAPLMPTQKSAEKELETSLKRTGAGYFDYYLLHSMMANNYKKYEKFHLWDFVREQKEKGAIRHVGFSYHSGPKLLDQILSEHPEVDFVQLQINYADWENPSVTSRANYETVRKHGKAVVIMEPVKGGNLAKPPAEVEKIMKEMHPDASCASWAIRFAASLDGVLTVLSGMSNVEQMKDNLATMKNFKPLDEEEQKVIQKAQKIIGHSGAIGCTACHYCTRGCPKQIAIPEIFAAMNQRTANGQYEQASAAYEKAAPAGHRASDCIQCRQCENACPQHLKITELLKQCAQTFEKEKE